MGVRRKTLGLVVLVLALAGCAKIADTDFPVSQEAQQELNLENVEIVRLEPSNIAAYATPRQVQRSRGQLPTSTRSWKYRVGVGDVLSITVWDHPELSPAAGGQASAAEAGIPVRADGTIFYPYVRDVQVAGRDVADIQRELTTRLAEFIPDPQVAVKVAAFNSQKVVISGEVAKPGTLKVTNIPLTLVEAVTQSGGLTADANGREVRITRAGYTNYVDLESFLRHGKRQGNPVLRGGDVVYIPDLGNNVAYVLGQVMEPGTVDLGQDGLSLTDALALKGGLDESEANARGIFVFRALGEGRYRVFQLDASTPVSLALGTRFSLYPQDVVYVVADPIAKWNAAIASLLPSITVLDTVQNLRN